MKVFIMWSGSRSRLAATALRKFLKAVVQRPQYFISTDDIETGAVWSNVVAGQLETTHVGIACLTSENLQSPWIHFEAGAVSKLTADAIVIPYLIGVSTSELTGPLTKFQATLADKRGTLSLVDSINGSLPDSDRAEPDAVQTVFDALWPNFEMVIKEAVESSEQEETVSRPQEDILREILDRLRQLERDSASSRFQHFLPTASGEWPSEPAGE